MVSYELLIKYGFIKSSELDNYTFNEKSGIYEPKSRKYEQAHANEEIEEIPFVHSSGDPGKGSYYRFTGFPKPKKRFKIIWEVQELNIEEPYYWVYNYLVEDLGFPKVIKTEDVFSASENSAFFGVSQQRLGAQQDKISQFLATVGKMIKELFQLVRELRILDERIGYYGDAENELAKPLEKRAKSAEITLKGIFIDLVQGGSKNPGSVFGMARELEFTTLPDIFFDAPPIKISDIETFVNGLQFNKNVLNVLRRQLDQFIRWKERTFDEVKVRRRFTLQYLLQHYEIIRMYMAWIKPYLRHVQRLTMKQGFESEPELISSFESSMLDIEVMAQRDWDKYSTVIIATFQFRTHPSLKFVQEGYQRGPSHVGKMTMHLRGYVWTQEQVNKYVKMKEAEDFELMKSVSGAVASAMGSLGDELQKYLDEARKLPAKQENAEEKKQPETLFRRMFRDFLPEKMAEPKKPAAPKVDEYALKKQHDSVAKDLDSRLFLCFKNFKKGHGMIMW